MQKTNDLDKYENFLRIWGKGIHYEISFWDKWVSTKGMQWQDDYISRLNPLTQIRDDIKSLMNLQGGKSFQILDVGSGPITNIGYIYNDYKINLFACDPLAGAYKNIFNQYNIIPPVITKFAMAEKLSEVFEKNSFDIILCNNALDHTFDPIAGISEMISLLKPGGTLLLSHNENEAECEFYSGFHQWNFTEKDNDFIIWNKENNYNITSKYLSYAKIQTSRTGENKNWIQVIITKVSDGANFSIYPKYIIDYGLINFCAELIMSSNTIIPID